MSLPTSSPVCGFEEFSQLVLSFSHISREEDIVIYGENFYVFFSTDYIRNRFHQFRFSRAYRTVKEKGELGNM